MIIGTIASTANGVALPLFAIIFGDITNSFSPLKTPDQVIDEVG